MIDKKQLIYKAGFGGAEKFTNELYYDKRLIKLIDSVVKECCQKLEDDGMVEVAIELKQHFGVE